MQYALIRIVCIVPGTTRNESVSGLNRNDTPSPRCSGLSWPRRVCTTCAFGGTITVFHRHQPVIRTSTLAAGAAAGAAIVCSWICPPSSSTRRENRACALGIAASLRARRSTATCCWFAMTCSIYSLSDIVQQRKHGAARHANAMS